MLGVVSGLALGLAAGLWARPRVPQVVVMMPEPVEPSFPWREWAEMSERDEIPEWTPEDVEWLARLADSWTPVTEAEELFEQSSEEESSGEEEW